MEKIPFLNIKKIRIAGRELFRDNLGFDDDAEQEIGTFKRVSEEVLLASRRIAMTNRQQRFCLYFLFFLISIKREPRGILSI